MTDEITPALTLWVVMSYEYEATDVQGVAFVTEAAARAWIAETLAAEAVYVAEQDVKFGRAPRQHEPSNYQARAVTLHGQPFGFTHADADRALAAAMQYADLAKWVEQGWLKGPVSIAEFRRLELEHMRLADKIAALLPPPA